MILYRKRHLVYDLLNFSFKKNNNNSTPRCKENHIPLTRFKLGKYLTEFKSKVYDSISLNLH